MLSIPLSGCYSSALVDGQSLVNGSHDITDCNFNFPYAPQIFNILEAGPVTTIKASTGQEVQFFGFDGDDADFYRFFARRPDMGEDNQSLLDNIDLIESDWEIEGTFSEIAQQIDDSDIDFCIGLQVEVHN